MKLRRQLRITQQGFPAALYWLFCRLAPEGIQPGGGLWLDDASTISGTRRKISVIVALCRAFRVPWSKLGTKTGTFGYTLERVYGSEDLDHCEFLELCGMSATQGAYERDDQGRLILQATNAARLDKFGRVGNHYVVSEQGRQIFESASMKGVLFRDVNVVAAGAGERIQACWEVVAGILLPAMANKNLWYLGTKQHPKPEPFTGDFSRPVRINEPPFLEGEIHYRRSDLKSLEPFDLAESMELTRRLIISQRFYRLLRDNEIVVLASPVRIDPD